jgi:hypothetical protein
MAITGTKAVYAVVGVGAAVGLVFGGLHWAEGQRLKDVGRLREQVVAARPKGVAKGTAIDSGGPTFAELEQIDLESLDAFRATVPMPLISFEDHLKESLHLLATGYVVAQRHGKPTIYPKV